MTLSTADAPFFLFLGRAKFEFFSNDTTVLGVDKEEALRHRPKQTDGEDHGDDVRYKEFPFGEQTFSLFNYNYNTYTDRAAVEEVVLLEGEYEKDGLELSGSIKCKNCYMYAGPYISSAHVAFLVYYLQKKSSLWAFKI
jgi:hypothetical protein